MRLSLKIFTILFSALLFTSVHADMSYVTGLNNNIALQGADPVAYFTDGKYLKGNSSFQITYDGVTWQFTNSEHLELFKLNPQQFIPQYHGYSAYDMAQGKMTASLPNLWCIYQRKLYLNRSAKTHQAWLRNKGSFITGGDLNWKRMAATASVQ